MGRDLYDSLVSEEADEPVILNLASKEYSKCIEDYLEDPVRMITCVFGEKKGGKVRQKATLAKMARGEMVRFLAENQIEQPEGIKEFRGLGFSYSKEDSEEDAESTPLRKKKDRHVYSRFTYSFQIFQSNQQRLYSGISGSLGEKKGNPDCRSRRFLPIQPGGKS